MPRGQGSAGAGKGLAVGGDEGEVLAGTKSAVTGTLPSTLPSTVPSTVPGHEDGTKSHASLHAPETPTGTKSWISS
ncbi:hypothetical protein DQ384_27720 [Sphaerisporangium album]|uniref:Uncharacterized protein n=1 Tax=Sphaerisporangium album TaxID=509200 RepID=A0A367FBI3_9ACTN|nr:hypothetical protein DQ384_27720 [Sphaerisporangium album]